MNTILRFPSSDDRHDAAFKHCMADMDPMLSRLTDKHGVEVVMGTLAMQVGTALHSMSRTGKAGKSLAQRLMALIDRHAALKRGVFR